MGSALNLAAKGSQCAIQGANSLARNMHARTRQPPPAGHSQSFEPVGRRASRTANPFGGRGQKLDPLTVWHCLLPVSTLPGSPSLMLFFFFPGDPVSHVSQRPRPRHYGSSLPSQASCVGDWGQPY